MWREIGESFAEGCLYGEEGRKLHRRRTSRVRTLTECGGGRRTAREDSHQGEANKTGAKVMGRRTNSRE